MYWFFAWIAACVTSNLISRRVIVHPGWYCDVSSSRSYRWRFAHDGEREIPPNGGSSFKKRITDVESRSIARGETPFDFCYNIECLVSSKRVVDDHNQSILSTEKPRWKSEKETNARIDHDEHTYARGNIDGDSDDDDDDEDNDILLPRNRHRSKCYTCRIREFFSVTFSILEMVLNTGNARGWCTRTVTHLVLRGSRCGILVPKKSCSFSATFEHDSTETETRQTSTRRKEFCPKLCYGLFYSSRQFWRLIRFDLFLSLNPTRRKTFVVVPFFSSFALLASDVTCENAPRETRLTRDRTVFSKAPHDYYWPEYTTQTTDWSMGMRTASCAVYSGSNRLWTVYRHLSSKSWYKKFMISTTFNRPWIKPTFTLSSE